MVSSLYRVSNFSGSRFSSEGEDGRSLIDSYGEKTSPWDVKATSTVALQQSPQSPQPGEERMALGFTQRPG